MLLALPKTVNILVSHVRQIHLWNRINKKVISLFKYSNPIVFDTKMAQVVKDINLSLPKNNKEAFDFGLKKGPVRDNASRL